MLAQGLIPEDDEERWLVSQIRANRECVVAAIGGKILAWRTEAIFKKKGGFGGKTGKVTARQERFKGEFTSFIVRVVFAAQLCFSPFNQLISNYNIKSKNLYQHSRLNLLLESNYSRKSIV